MKKPNNLFKVKEAKKMVSRGFKVFQTQNATMYER